MCVCVCMCVCECVCVYVCVCGVWVANDIRLLSGSKFVLMIMALSESESEGRWLTVCLTGLPRSDIGDLNTMHDATMITTLFSVLATLCVTGPKGGYGEKVEGWIRSDVTLSYIMSCCVVILSVCCLISNSMR